MADTTPTDTTAGDATAVDAQPDASIGPGQCTAEILCEGGQMCLAPGQPPPCGICFQPEPDQVCGPEQGCPAGQACKPLACACGGESTCQPGCQGEADCGLGETCTPSGACVGKTCKKLEDPENDPNCPADFVCVDPSDPHCARKPCTASSECEGHCVGGFCHAEPGSCMFPPP